MKLMLPPLPDQKDIVKILEKANTLRKKRQEADEISNKVIHSIFLEMFGDPLKKQKKFADLVQKVEKIKEKQQDSKKELDTLFSALMQKAFRG